MNRISIKQPVKVLQVFASLNVGGAESRMMDIYRKIDRTKIQFDFVTLEEEKQFFEDEIKHMGGYVFHLASPRQVGIARHIKELRQCMRAGQYHAVHAHTSYHCGCVMLAAYLEKIPVRAAHARTTSSIQSGWKTKLFIYAGRALNALFATERVAISEDAGKFVFGTDKFEVIPNAIDLEKYKNPDDKENYRKQFHIPDEALVIGHVGRFDRFKNQAFAVNWFARYPNKNSCLVLVGDGKQKQAIEEQAKEADLSDRVIFTGIRSDIPELMNLFDVLLFPSLVEGLGGVVLETQAAGTPAVISEAVPKEVDMGLDLIEVCSLNAGPEVWTQAVQKNLSKPRPSFETIKQAFDKHKYSLDYAVNKLEDLYTKG